MRWTLRHRYRALSGILLGLYGSVTLVLPLILCSRLCLTEPCTLSSLHIQAMPSAEEEASCCVAAEDCSEPASDELPPCCFDGHCYESITELIPQGLPEKGKEGLVLPTAIVGHLKLALPILWSWQTRTSLRGTHHQPSPDLTALCILRC
ncbi:MAG: hypothetical protein NZ960_05025 [Candidatus Kapabacteria bacterium]|nr:hypothetical protein [Candidatus Kapabacteria bacterium]MDW8012992.1 hypothetical protein [Bacteroidota bacterium]